MRWLVWVGKEWQKEIVKRNRRLQATLPEATTSSLFVECEAATYRFILHTHRNPSSLLL